MPSRSHTHRGGLEKATLWHVSIFVIAAAWMFGGRIDWARPPLIIWGLAGAALTIYGLVERRQTGNPVKRWLVWLIPPMALSLWVLLSSFNPSFEVVLFFEQQVYRPLDPIAWLPSSALPSSTREELLLTVGIFLSAYNLALNVSQRRTLRQLTLVLGVNACVIAVFGTIQKIAGTEMFFGLQESPNPSFFGSFIYHNHWGPFALLNIAGWFGLIEHLSRDDRGRGVLHSPATLALMAILLLSVTIPLSTSRSSTVMLSLLLPICGFWLLWRLGRRRSKPVSRRLLVIIGLLSLAFCAIAAVQLGGESIQHRLSDTREQIADIRESGSLGQRPRVYADTWRFIMTKPVAGWGLESYALVYRRYNSEATTIDGFTVQFDEAHSDWLQLMTEVGFVGTALFLLTVSIPLWSLRHRLLRDPYSGCPFICLGLIALYAWLEFPFANPAIMLSSATAFFCAIRYLQLGGEIHGGHHHHHHH